MGNSPGKTRTRVFITYSAYREMETIPQSPLREIGEAIVSLADDPHPPSSSLLRGIGGLLLYPDRSLLHPLPRR